MLIGISSHENDYRLVWAMNNELSFRFVRVENLKIHNAKENTDLEFSHYTHMEEERYITFHLVSNRCDNGFLFPEIKNIDFLFQVAGDMNRKEIADLLQSLKKIPILSAAFLIDPRKLKDADKKLVH